MGNKSEMSDYKRLNFSSLKFSDKTKSLSEALENTSPINWSQDILNGERKVCIKK